jgi:phosphatidylglycerol:prolipoprotein diacylglycerol transferase
MLSALPYVQPPSCPIDLPLWGSHTITVFGPLAALGIVAGWRQVLRYARARDLDVAAMDGLLLRVVVVGLVVSHWVSMLLYFPDRVLADPWVLLPIGGGLSSVGGFAGGLMAFACFVRRRNLPVLSAADALAFGLLTGFTIGRVGCSLVHDHPGAVVDAGTWLAVGLWPDGTHRYDLGLVELVGLLGLCTLVYGVLPWRRWPPGRLTAVVAILYGLGRGPLDLLRADDARYLHLTPAQYACAGFVVLGTWTWIRSAREHAQNAPKSAPD